MNKKILFSFIIIIFIFCFFITSSCCSFSVANNSKEDNLNFRVLKNLVGLSIDEVIEYGNVHNIKINVSFEYSDTIEENSVISQDIVVGTELTSDSVVNVIVSKGKNLEEAYIKNNVNELGNVPIMMYHGIVNVLSSDTKYIGGNVDRDGYNRTVEAFRNDLEFYYKSGYRMISLDDYINGNVDVPLGYSPIILTFDDGNVDNFRVLGEKDGELVIDPNSAIGVLEEFKKKYPDFGVTATFFVNSGLFMQEEYDEKILKWLVKNGYDVGNHTISHCDFTKLSLDNVSKEVGGMYQILDRVIPDEYVSIIALPFGSPYNKSHSSYEKILSGEYNNFNYQTIGALRVGWEAEVSCFSKSFDATFLKRIRAYDNMGRDFDIEMNFKLLEKNRYISDGDTERIVIPSQLQDKLGNNNYGLEVITY